MKFKIGAAQVEILLEIYEHFLTVWTPADDAEQLHFEHMRCLFEKLEEANSKETKWRHFKMSSAEALAFYQFWNVTDTSAWEYATAVICNIIEKIDQQTKTPKRLTNGR